MDCAGILLTGGASSRFGRDKASAPWGDTTLARRAGAALAAVASPAVEVGPGLSGLGPVADERQGPLAAVAAAVAAIGTAGPALVLACDLPLVGTSLLRWLAAHPSPGSVVPTAGRPPRPQPLCARWSAVALASAGALVSGGERSMRALVAGADVVLVSPEEWASAAAPWGESALDDADTPDALGALRARFLEPRP